MREDIHHRQPDGTMIYGRKYGQGNVGVLILPSFGESIIRGYHDRLAQQLAGEEFTVYLLELRGHRLSDGQWSMHAFRADVTYWISYFKEHHKKLLVVATGLSASTMLEYDDQAHRFRKFPPLVDGMLCIAPIFSGDEILPPLDTLSHRTHNVAPTMTKNLVGKALARKFPHVTPHDPVRAWSELAKYSLSPVRLQTPTTILLPGDEMADPLKRIFGNVSLRREQWLHVKTRAGLAGHLSTVVKEFRKVYEGEKPIRFKV